ncbi:MAG: STAS domain-containing protein [Singulisphaera sp.]
MSQVPGPHFHLEIIDGVTVVRLNGPKLVIDASGPLSGLVEEGGHRKLLLDFAAVRFLSSAALGVLMGLRQRVEAAGGELRLCRLDPSLLELFRLTRLEELFENYDDERDAIAQF